MKAGTWKKFAAARDIYKESVEQLSRSLPNLRRLQQKLVDTRSGPAYTVETPVVYNEALDEMGSKDEIKLILVADNPGRREQAAENRRYLVGPSGKITERFFREEPSLGIDFRKNVLILNKTPIHTPRTVELRELCRLGGPALTDAIAQSQLSMVKILEEFYQVLSPIPVWIIGYSEMKKNGIFEVYTEALKKVSVTFFNQLYFYRHFSMNQFTIDLHKQAKRRETTAETLERIGTAYRERILGK
ncbi:hypothetical protein [Treponema primitia]|uniref:hypothetical protein n=1 Tax=Treponema primitia TaxID=88058 RepID=UPI0002554E0A|nr:hypothetical protein [Treponema primitia]